LVRAVLIDAVALVAGAVGRFKLRLQRRSDEAVPHYLADLWRHSVIRPGNRTLGPRQTPFPRPYQT